MHEVIDERRLKNLVCPIGLPMHISIQKHQLSKVKGSSLYVNSLLLCVLSIYRIGPVNPDMPSSTSIRPGQD